ncbi:LAMI_0F15764g1_1 [Lachancea mirantina]|uniref:LAMI_0F15764g1_1 n=1 Tax=Lachancea mirantina TaxID=1230905 RepID=A0A1G4K4G5_9SACH|nr:LAMI_0F15764g1_1 [Lachancea mirantina]
MGLFRKSSSSSGGSGGHPADVKLTKEDREHLKIRTASVHDPILEAVQEAQPFEQAADAFQTTDPNRQSYYSGEHAQGLRDVFGQPINQPDISNPTRSRDERPLDTIRGFEYSISGDPSWGQRLETQQYGFHVRPDFPSFGNSNPYNSGSGYPAGPGAPVGSSYAAEQAVYTAPAPAEQAQGKKKKRGLFGRKKKN